LDAPYTVLVTIIMYYRSIIIVIGAVGTVVYIATTAGLLAYKRGCPLAEFKYYYSTYIYHVHTPKGH